MINVNNNDLSEKRQKPELDSTDKYLVKYRNLSGASRFLFFVYIGFFSVGLQFIAAQSTMASWGWFGLRSPWHWLFVGFCFSTIGFLGVFRSIKMLR